MRWVIVGGAPLRDREWIRSLLRDDDYFVYCDSGLRHRALIGREPDLIVGDFDSHENPHLDAETIVLPREKDDTDCGYAVSEGCCRGCGEFLLLGSIGGRIDHTLGNLALLRYLFRQGKRASMADDYSLMEIVGKDGALVRGEYPWFSLISLGDSAEGVTVENVKYPLRDACIRADHTLGISNEVLPGGEAKVTVKRGELLLIRTRRDIER